MQPLTRGEGMETGERGRLALLAAFALAFAALQMAECRLWHPGYSFFDEGHGNLAGALLWIEGGAFASRSLGQSFAAVRLDGHPGVHVYADNQPVGVTDRNGFLMVPGLRPFDLNTIRVDEDDLPLDFSLAAGEITKVSHRFQPSGRCSDSNSR